MCRYASEKNVRFQRQSHEPIVGFRGGSGGEKKRRGRTVAFLVISKSRRLCYLAYNISVQADCREVKTDCDHLQLCG